MNGEQAPGGEAGAAGGGAAPAAKPPKEVGYLEDDHGNPSSMRLMSVVALLASICFGLLTIQHPAANKDANGLYITIAFLLAAFAPKALQKFVEGKFPKKD